MKKSAKILTLIIAWVVVIKTHCQVINMVYNDSLKKYFECPYMPLDIIDGTYKIFYDSTLGSVKSMGQILNGYKQGEWIEYHQKGEIKGTGKYLDSRKVGRWIYYYDDGAVYIMAKYRKCAYRPLFTRVYTHSKSHIYFLRKNLGFVTFPDGEYEKWYKSGIKAVEKKYDKVINFWDTLGNQLVKNETGIYYELYPNGKLRLEYSLTKGKYEGPYFKWYTNGEYSYKCDYKKAKLNGDRIFFSESGDTIRIESFKNDKLHGLSISYFSNGKVASKNSYLNGKFHGQQITNWANGNMKRKVNYENGKVNGFNYVWYKNGQLEWEGEFKNGKPIGTHKFYDKNGNLIKETSYD